MLFRRRTAPRVSVIMPAFNQARYCRAAIGSVLGQTLRDLELIIIDDGSTDDTGAIIDATAARDQRICVVHRRHAGVSASINLGILLARAENLARQDADDLSVEHRLETQLAFLENHSNVAVVGADLLCIAEDGRPIRRISYPAGDADLHQELLRSCPIGHPATMLRRSMMMKVGGYRPIFDFAEDYDLWLRVSEHADLANIPMILVHYRVHGASTTQRHYRQQRFRSQVALLAALRRRSGKSDPCGRATVLDDSILDLLEVGANDRQRMTALFAEAMREDADRKWAEKT